MRAEKYEVVAIGNAIVDVIRRCDDAFLVCIGARKGQMHLVKKSSDIAAVCQQLKPGFDVSGGSAANTAVGVASLGGRAAFVGIVAEDDFGRAFRHDIRGAGVEFETGPRIDGSSETSHSLILITPDGQRTMLTFVGCSAQIDAATIDSATIKGARAVYLEGYLLDSPSAKSAIRSAISIARSAGRAVALALCDAATVSRHRAEVLELLRHGVSIVFANEAEIAALYNVKSFDDAVRNAARDIELAVLTRNARGSLILSRGVQTHIQAEPVGRVVDATGAGDMYSAGFLHGVAIGMDAASAARLGSFAAAEILSVAGARPEVRLAHAARLRGFLT